MFGLSSNSGTASLPCRKCPLSCFPGRAAMAGFGLTPLALAPAPLATQAKVPAVVMAAATATITEASPYIVRTSFTLPQATVPMADWASQNGLKKVVTLVSDYGPGIDAEKAFTGNFTKA